MLIFSSIVALLLVRSASLTTVDYNAQCLFSSSSSSSLSSSSFEQEKEVACQVALFSHFAFNVSGDVRYSPDSDLCDGSTASASPDDDRKFIAVVKRGVCSFETKAQTARSIGAIGLVVINSNSSIFPMGPSGPTSIPVVMIAADALDWLQTTSETVVRLIKGEWHTFDLKLQCIHLTKYFS